MAQRASAAAPPVADGTVEKAIDVLFALQAHSAPQGVTSLARALGIPKSSVHRLLASLGHRGLVERDERGHYRLGIGLVSLGLDVLEKDPVIAAARPVLEREASTIGETVFLVGARGEALMVLDKVEGTGFLRASPQVGAEVPVHATAVGKLYLAFDRAQLGARTSALERFTDRTPTSEAVLAKQVERARRDGFAVNRDEWIDGLTVVAAPVWYGERLVAALALAAPSSRARELGPRSLALRVRRAAEGISERLAGSASRPLAGTSRVSAPGIAPQRKGRTR